LPYVLSRTAYSAMMTALGSLRVSDFSNLLLFIASIPVSRNSIIKQG
jgi:hypothetical protein